MPVGDGPGREHCAVQDQEAHRTQEADGHLLRAGGSRAPGILLGPTFGEKKKNKQQTWRNKQRQGIGADLSLSWREWFSFFLLISRFKT